MTEQDSLNLTRIMRSMGLRQITMMGSGFRAVAISDGEAVGFGDTAGEAIEEAISNRNLIERKVA